jgi:hypothetical protein
MPSFLNRVAQATSAALLCASMGSHAHGVGTGDLQLDHPYAVPSAVGESHGKAYFRGIKNTGAQAERFDLTLDFEHTGRQPCLPPIDPVF